MIFLALFLFAPLSFGAVQPWARSILSLFLYGLLAIFLKRRSESVFLPPHWFSALWLLLCALALLSAAYSPYPSESLRQSFELLQVFLLVVVLMNIFSQREAAFFVIYALITLACFFAVLAYARVALGVLPSDRPGLAGPFVNHNHFCGLLEITTALALSLLVFGLRKQGHAFSTLFLFASSPILLVTLVLTRSRGGISSFVFAVLAVGFASLFLKTRRQIFFYYLLSVGFLLLLGLLLKWPLVWELTQSAMQERFRFQIWDATLLMIAERPLFGFGQGSFGWVSYIYRSPEVGHHLNYAHNEYLQVASELGIVGLAVFAANIVAVPVLLLRRSEFKHRTLTLAVAIGVSTAWVSLALHALYDFNYHIPANVVFLAAAIAAAFTILEQRVSFQHSVLTQVKFRRGVGLLLAVLSLSAVIGFTADWLAWRGQRFLTHDAKQAARYLQWATRLAPWSAEYQTWLGGAWMQSGQLAQAESAFHAALRRNRMLPNNYYHLGIIAERQGKLAEANRHFSAAVALDPQEISKAAALARSWVALGDAESALLVCRDLVRRFPSELAGCLALFEPLGFGPDRLHVLALPSPTAQRIFGRFLIDHKEWGWLDEWARLEAARTPPLPHHHYFLARAAREKQALKESVYLANDGLARFPGDRDLVELLVQTYPELGRWEEAFQVLRQQMVAQDTEVFWVEKLVNLYYGTNRPDEAYAVLLEQKQKRASSRRIRELLVDYFLRVGDWTGAIRMYKELLARGHELPEYHVGLAQLYVKADFIQDAFTHYEKALRLDPKRSDVMLILGDLSLQIGLRDRAAEYFHRALELEPKNATALARLAEIGGAK